METGIVFDIKRFAIHDGPGIRTTVFMKGCPLRCTWCHNPEGMDKIPFVDYQESSCIQCGICVAACPQKCISFAKSEAENSISAVGKVETCSDRCNCCGACVEKCPTASRTMVGKWYTPKELVREILKDQVFFQPGEGGVTFSGGEAMMQADFLTEVMKLCKKEKIHIALDTSGYAPREKFEQLLPYVDLYLYDIKQMDPEKHKKWTGVERTLIESNLRYLASQKKTINIRIPVIPGYNDEPENFQKIIGLLKELPVIKEINLLPYHDTAKGKYIRLTGRYLLENISEPDERTMEQYKKRFEDEGYKVRIGG